MRAGSTTSARASARVASGRGQLLDSPSSEVLHADGSECAHRLLFPMLDRFAAHAQTEFDVGHHVEMREQSERLEDQADIPARRRYPLHPLSPDPDLSSVWLIEPGDEAHHRGLATPARADHRDEFPRDTSRPSPSTAVTFPNAW